MHVGGKDSAQVITMPPFIFLGGMILGGALEYFFPLPVVYQFPFSLIVGLMFVVSGIVLILWAGATFEKQGTNIDPREPSLKIVSGGPFTFTRNPMYVGMVLFMTGVALMFQSLWITIFLVPAILLVHFGVILREEAYLEKKFGDEYKKYKSRVHRWI